MELWTQCQAEAAWRKRDISECILSAEPACSLSVGQVAESLKPCTSLPQPGDLMVAYLCGQAPHCSLVGDRGALATAKANVETFYPAVGVLEELGIHAALYSTATTLCRLDPRRAGACAAILLQRHAATLLCPAARCRLLRPSPSCPPEPHRNRNSGDRSISLAARRRLEGWLAVELVGLGCRAANDIAKYAVLEELAQQLLD
jgi:hypothetical protein